MDNLLGIICSFGYIYLILLMSQWLMKKGWEEEVTRKFVHILLTNYWLIASCFFSTVFWASFVPAVFIIVNFIVYKKGSLPSIQRKGTDSLGIVYYPISLLILSIWSFSSYGTPLVGALGIFVMGYGDGLAALIGKKYGRKDWLPGKTLIGTLTMFVVSFCVVWMILWFNGKNDRLLTSLILALIATTIEAFTPYGLDNLTVPLSVSFIYQFFFL